MQAFIKQAAIKVYCAGIGINTIYSMYDRNKIILRQQEKGNNIDFNDYAMYSMMGLLFGGYTGLFWPITAIGQCTLAIDKILTVSKNN